MLKRLTVLALCVAVAGCITPPQETEFSKVYEAPGLSKTKIYDAAKIWIAENFRSAKQVIEYEKDGTLIGNGSMAYPCSGLGCMGKDDWLATFTMRVDTKDNRYRLTFRNIGLSWPAFVSTMGIVRPAYDGPVRTQAEFNDIRPVLLTMGDRMYGTMVREKANKNW